MPDAPLITITDPRDPREPSDVLVAGDERPPLRVPRRLVAAVALVALVGGATAYGVDRHRTQVAEQRLKAAAFAKADALHAHVALVGDGTVQVAPNELIGDVVTTVDGVEVTRSVAPDTGVIELALQLTDDPGTFDGIADVRLLGSGLTQAFDPGVLSGRAPGGDPTQFSARGSFSCSDVAAGRYPTYDKAEVDVLPASGKVHTVTLTPSRGQSGRQLALLACQLPDPDAVPTMSMQEQNGRFLVELQPVPYDPSTTRVVRITAAGLQLTSGLDRVFPGGAPPSSGVLFDVGVRVTDCAAAKAGDLSVHAVVRAGAKTYDVEVTDAAATDVNRTGSSLLRAKVARACG